MRKKEYGNYKVEKCPFCERVSSVKNNQGIPTCTRHKDKELNDLKCACGEYLDLMNGKYGIFFNCMNCGNINYNKAIQMNQARLV